MYNPLKNIKSMLHESIIHLYSLFVNNAHKFCFLSIQSQTLFTRTTNLYMLLNHGAIRISLKNTLPLRKTGQVAKDVTVKP